MFKDDLHVFRFNGPSKHRSPKGTAIDCNVPQGSRKGSLKRVTRVAIDVNDRLVDFCFIWCYNVIFWLIYEMYISRIQRHFCHFCLFTKLMTTSQFQ